MSLEIWTGSPEIGTENRGTLKDIQAVRGSQEDWDELEVELEVWRGLEVWLEMLQDLMEPVVLETGAARLLRRLVNRLGLESWENSSERLNPDSGLEKLTLPDSSESIETDLESSGESKDVPCS